MNEAITSTFDWACGRLEELSHLDRLEARGTMRIALRAAGLQPEHVSPDELAHVLRKLMPEEMEKRGSEDAHALCERIACEVVNIEGLASSESPEEIFSRLGS